jgi:hypothetical protein
VPVDADDRAVGCAQQPELHADRDAVAIAPAERLADQQLVVAGRVVVAGVQERDASVESGVDRGDALGLVGGAVEVGHPHAAETDLGDPEAGRAERSHVHELSPFRCAMTEFEFCHLKRDARRTVNAAVPIRAG